MIDRLSQLLKLQIFNRRDMTSDNNRIAAVIFSRPWFGVLSTNSSSEIRNGNSWTKGIWILALDCRSRKHAELDLGHHCSCRWPSTWGLGYQQAYHSKVHGATMGPIWGRQDPGGPHVGPMNLAIWVVSTQTLHIGGSESSFLLKHFHYIRRCIRIVI